MSKLLLSWCWLTIVWQDVFIGYVETSGNYGATRHANEIWLNDGTGMFALDEDNPLLGNLKQTHSAAFADVNNDGHVDIVIGNGCNDQTQTTPISSAYLAMCDPLNQLWLNTGTGNFTLWSEVNVSSPLLAQSSATTWAMEFADVNADGFIVLQGLSKRRPCKNAPCLAAPLSLSLGFVCGGAGPLRGLWEYRPHGGVLRRTGSHWQRRVPLYE